MVFCLERVLERGVDVRLSSELKQLKENFIAGADPAALETMQQAMLELKASGIVEQALGVEKRVPQFTLDDERGVSFALSDFLSRGPVILHFFRGFW